MNAPHGWHTKRMTEAIAHEAAQFIAQEAGTQSLITVTRAQTLNSDANVTVFVTVLPVEQMAPALNFLERQREAFSKYLKTHANLGALPRINFQIDTAE